MTRRGDWGRFVEFCRGLVERYRYPGTISPETLAREFASQFQLFPPVDLDVLIGAAESLGIPASPANMPGGLRGFHHGNEENYAILYREGEWVGSIRHTILHEVCEIIEKTLADLQPDYRPPRGPDLEIRADKFAAAVLLPRNGFRLLALTSAFNPLHLQQHYRQAYSSLLLRLTEVFDEEIPLQVIMYENPAISALLDLKNHLHPANLGDLIAQCGGPDQYHVSLVSTTSAFRYFYRGLWAQRELWVSRGESLIDHRLGTEAMERGQHLRRRRFLRGIPYELESKNLYCDIWLIKYYGTAAKVIIVGLPLCVRHELEVKHNWNNMHPIYTLLQTALGGMVEYLEGPEILK